MNNLHKISGIYIITIACSKVKSITAMITKVDHRYWYRFFRQLLEKKQQREIINVNTSVPTFTVVPTGSRTLVNFLDRKGTNHKYGVIEKLKGK